MMRKKTNYTHITPLPPHIPRKLAIDLLHAHSEIITVNPLVLDFQPIKAPRDAPSDEYYSTWYEIEQRIQYVPGMGKMGAGKIKFKGVFHDMEYGLQTHTYAPANVDLRNKYRICGNQPGEPREIAEIGIGAPADGLYLREDVEIKCNITMASFVKKEMKAASAVWIDRLIKKAELLDSGALQALMEDGKLKTLNPADRTNTLPVPPRSPSFAPPSPSMIPSRQSSVYTMQTPLQQRYSMLTPEQIEFEQFKQFQMQQKMMQQPPQGHPAYAHQQPQKYAQAQSFTAELPGDYYHASQDVPQHLAPAWKRNSNYSELSGSSPVVNDGRWSTADSESSRPSSYATDTTGMRSPKPEQTSFGSELAPMKETKEEHENRQTALSRLEGGQFQQHHHQQPQQQQHQQQQQQQQQHEKGWQPYNPADYARV
jgi:hypothetical protein